MSAAEEKLKWKALYENKNKAKKHLDVKIGVVGNDIGIGTSHIAMSLCCYLNSKGIVSFYKDCFDGNNIENIMARDKSFYERDNIIYHDSFKGVRTSGEAVLENILPKGLYILDYGIDVEKVKHCDFVIYVVSQRPYKRNEIDSIAYNTDTCVVVNPGSTLVGVEVARALGKKVYAFPIDEDPFSITKKKEKLFDRITYKLLGEK